MIEVLNKLDDEKLSLLEEDIVLYLAENPDVLIHFPDLYEKLLPPRKSESSGENVLNFHHRLLQSLQSSNKKLQDELKELFYIASENEAILAHFNAIESLMYGARSLNELLNSVCNEIVKRFSATYAHIALIEQNIACDIETHFQPVLNVTQGEHLKLFCSEGEFPVSFKRFTPLICNGSDLNSASSLFPKSEKNEINSAILLPLYKGEALLGSLNLASPTENRFHEGLGTDFLENLVQKLSVCIVNLMNREVIDETSLRDKVTGLYNHLFLGNVLPYEMNRAEHYNHPLSLLLIDIDDMKNISHSEEKERGDQVLQQLAELIQSQIGKSDIQARFMDDEFALILPEKELNEALEFAEDLRGLVEETCFGDPLSPISLTVSIGVSSYPSEKVARKKDLIEAADKALYVAKKGGKNRVA